MRFRRLSDTFLVQAETSDEALVIEKFLVEFGEEQPSPLPLEPPTPVPPPPPPRPVVAEEDVVYRLEAGVPFSEHSEYTLQCAGSFFRSTEIPELGILGGDDLLRFGKVWVKGRQGFYFAIDPMDKNTSGSKRCELRMPDVDPWKEYWVFFGILFPHADPVREGDIAVVGMQLHSGGSTGLSPAVSLHARGGSTLNFDARHSLSNPGDPRQSRSERSPLFPLVRQEWMDVILHFKYGLPRNGFLEAWVNGDKKMDYKGPLGYHNPSKPYFKFGTYNWSGLSTKQSLILYNPTVVLDPGGKYKFDHFAVR